MQELLDLNENYGMMSFFLITTDHLEDRLWFRDEEDFKVAMNYVAIVAYLMGVDVLAFILMSNHVHFVLQCAEEKAWAFITEFKRLYSFYLSRKYGAKESLRGNGVDVQPLGLDGELERAIAYVQMNCVAANICLNPADYPWGTGNCFFRAVKDKGRTLGSLSVRARNRMMHSKNMDYYLRNSSKAKRRLALGDEGLPAFRDQIILAAIPDLCQTLFHKWRLDELGIDQQSTLVSQIRRRFSADVNQIARVTGIPYPVVARMLEGF